MERRRDIAKRALVYCFIVTFTTAPLYLVVSLALQVGPPYSLVPSAFQLSSFSRLFSNLHDLQESLFFSLRVCLLGSALGLGLALVASYVIIGLPTSLRRRKRVLRLAIGIYLLPAFAVYPALSFFPLPSTASLVLVFVISSFALSLLLLLFTFSSMAKPAFEQLLLETHSRWRSFYHGVLRPLWLAIFTIFVVGFATTWSDFFLPALITTTSRTVKPFAVALQMGASQYHVDYALFAAGATVSLVITVAIPTIVLLPFWWLARRPGGGGRG